MADYEQAFQRVIFNEGGFTLSDVKNDRGGQTFAGIARNRWGNWDGWKHIDAGDTPPTDLVRQFYRENFWTHIRGDEIKSQRIAENIFDFGVNAGTGTAVKLAQITVGATPDGKFGPRTLDRINSVHEEVFVPLYALAKLARYRDICTKDKTQRVFLLGWINRLLREAA